MNKKHRVTTVTGHVAMLAVMCTEWRWTSIHTQHLYRAGRV